MASLLNSVNYLRKNNTETSQTLQEKKDPLYQTYQHKPKELLRKLQTNIPHENSHKGFKNNRKSNAVVNYIYVHMYVSIAHKFIY